MAEQYTEGQQRLPPSSVPPPAQMLPMHGMRPPPPGMLQVPPPMAAYQQMPPPVQMWSTTEAPDRQLAAQQHPAMAGKPPIQMQQQMPLHMNRLPELNNVNDMTANGNSTQNLIENANIECTESDADKKKNAELVLPKVLEDVLALKDQRAAEFHVNTEDFTATDAAANNSGVISNDYADADGESDDEQEPHMNGITDGKKNKESKAEKNKKKKRRKKQNKKLRKQVQEQLLQQMQPQQQQQQQNELEKDAKSKEQQTIENNESAAADKENLENGKNEKLVNSEVVADDAAAEDKSIKTDEKKKEHKSSKNKDRSSKKSESNKKKDNKKEITIDDVTIEYVPEKITIADLAPMYRQFYRVFEIFKLEAPAQPAEKEKDKNEATGSTQKKPEKPDEDDDDDLDENPKDEKEKLSKRKLKKLTRLSVAELKQLVSRPDVVEMHDVTARDPKLLVQLKAYRNTVQVPRHWCFKRKYLQGKRGIEKPPFDLPAFIKKTGIMEMRESLQERDEAKSLKSKMRDRVRPKMGKIDIDYQKLHDAFFKWQTKPRMTIHGDLYYEGKEYETRLKEKKPGDLSEELRIALGMPVGPNSHKIPPPWLIAQQRYGPPPSYPNLKIPGLNAPIPEGTSFGYHAGGWGKPPVDEHGKPLYGDVFGTNIVDMDNGIDEADIERAQWGDLESESEESSEEEEEDGEDMTNQPDESGLVTPAEGLITPSGLTSGLPTGLETPETIELRKKKIETEMEDNETPVLYQVLAEKRTDRIGASMMGSTHVYDIGTVNKPVATRTTTAVDREGIVELALDPSELDLDNEAMAQRYEQQMREQQNHLQKEDLSDMLAEHVARQKSKRKRAQGDTSKTNKKYKEFKF